MNFTSKGDLAVSISPTDGTFWPWCSRWKKQTGSKDYRQLWHYNRLSQMDIRTIVIPINLEKRTPLKKISEISFANSYSCILNFHKIYFKLRTWKPNVFSFLLERGGRQYCCLNTFSKLFWWLTFETDFGVD